MADDKMDPSVVSAAYAAMAPCWDKIDSVLAGTASMRARGEKYLPRHEKEPVTQYQERLNRTTLYNASDMTLNSWVGRPFREPIERSDEINDDMEDVLEDVDRQGNRVDVFARNWFKEGLAKGLAHILVDMPSKTDREYRSLADDRAAGLRPYWCFIKPENLIFASHEVIGGREVLTHVRIKETVIQRAGFGEVMVRRIRIFDRDDTGVQYSVWQLFDSQTEAGQSSSEWRLVEGPTKIDLPEIPLVTFYSDRCGFMLAKSPLEDLVDLNIRHWQSTSDQINVLTVARFPILAASGISQEEANLVIGPKKTLFTTDPAGKWYYLEHAGAAIAAGRQDLLDLKEEMANYGAEFLQKRPGGETATARALDSSESTSALQDATRRFNDALNQALVVTGMWMKQPEPGTLKIDLSNTVVVPDSGDWDALKTARAGRDISREAYLGELKRRGTLDEEFDAEKDKELLDQESLDGAPMDGEPIDEQAQGAAGVMGTPVKKKPRGVIPSGDADGE